MTSSSEAHSHPTICGECGREFASVKELGDHVDRIHRNSELKKDNPTNVGPGITEEYKTD